MSYERHLDVDLATKSCGERRNIARLDVPFPALVRGYMPNGRRFEEEITLDNLSAHGLHVRLSQTLVIGEPLFVLVRFTLGDSYRVPGPGVAARGIVLRTERLPDGHCGVAIMFLRHRLLFAL